MGKNKKKTFLYVIGFLTHFLFLCYLHPLTLQAQTKKEEIDITALSKQIEQLGEEKYPDFSSIFEKNSFYAVYRSLSANRRMVYRYCF